MAYGRPRAELTFRMAVSTFFYLPCSAGIANFVPVPADAGYMDKPNHKNIKTMRRILMLMAGLALVLGMTARQAQPQGGVKRVYDETLDRNEQIDNALSQAAGDGRYLMCQLGGNWCKWCLRLAAFIEADEELERLMADNYIYLHVNYNPRVETDDKSRAEDAAVLKRLGYPQRFGYPVLVVMDAKGNVLHIQDSSLLESGDGYDREKVRRFLLNWTPAAVAESRQ